MEHLVLEDPRSDEQVAMPTTEAVSAPFRRPGRLRPMGRGSCGARALVPTSVLCGNDSGPRRGELPVRLGPIRNRLWSRECRGRLRGAYRKCQGKSTISYENTSEHHSSISEKKERGQACASTGNSTASGAGVGVHVTKRVT